MITINIRDKGALGNGVDNDTSPICAAFASVAAAGGGCVYVPAGLYRIESAIWLNNISHNISIKGDGPNVSVFLVVGCDGFDFHFLQDSAFQQTWGITIRGVGFRASGAAGTAVNISYGQPPITNDHHRPSVSISNVVVQSTINGTWSEGIVLEGAWNPSIKDVFVSGDACGGNWDSMRGTGVCLKGMCVNAHLTNVRCNFWAAGLMAHGANTEGIFCSNSSMVAVKRGVWLKGDPNKPPGRISTLTWNGGLIECRVGGVTTGSAAFHLENVHTALIQGAQLLTETLVCPTATYGVIAQDCRGVVVTGCDINAWNFGLCATGEAPDFVQQGNIFINTQNKIGGSWPS